MNQSDGGGSNADVTLSLLGAAQAVEARIECSLSPLGLSLAKLNVLEFRFVPTGPWPFGRLAMRSAPVHSIVRMLLKRRRSAGLVRREADPEDRRSIRAVVTDAGRDRERAGSTALGRVQDDISQVLAGYDAAHIERALSALKE